MSTLKAAASALALTAATFAAGLGPVAGEAEAQGRRTAPLAENVGPAPTLTPETSVLLLIDQQTGLAQMVRDQSPDEFRNNVLGLARAAKAMGVPVILTTSRDWGPNGAFLPELKALFPDAPVIRRQGIINAYRDPEFRRAVDPGASRS